MNLVGGIPTPLKNMSSSVGMIIHDYSQYMESHKKNMVPNHQSVNPCLTYAPCMVYLPTFGLFLGQMLDTWSIWV